MTISFLVWQEAFKINLAKLDNHPKTSGNLGKFWKTSILVRGSECLHDFIRPPGPLSLFGTCDKFGIELLTKIRVSFSDLRDHRFNPNFNCESPICSCGIEDETSVHFFLRCPRYATQRSALLSKISGTIGPDASVFPEGTCNIFWVYGSNV